jgi:hypothetical protein
MNRHYSKAEMADIHYTNGWANGNSREALCLYREAYPHPRYPAKDTFTVIHWRLTETGTFSPVTAGRRWGRFSRTLHVEEQVFDMTSRDPGTSARQVAAVVGVSHQRVCVESSSGSASLLISRAAPLTNWLLSTSRVFWMVFAAVHCT